LPRTGASRNQQAVKLDRLTIGEVHPASVQVQAGSRHAGAPLGIGLDKPRQRGVLDGQPAAEDRL
jgi:hypothetical protein